MDDGRSVDYTIREKLDTVASNRPISETTTETVRKYMTDFEHPFIFFKLTQVISLCLKVLVLRYIFQRA